MGTAVDPPKGTPARTSAGRIDQFRARAEAARRRYEELAQRQPLYGIPLTCLATYAARQGMLLASAIAFRLFFWVLPVVLLGISLLSGLGRSGVYEAATDATGISGAARAEVLRALSQGGQSWWILAVISLFGVVWTTMLLRRALVLVNAHLWDATFVKTRPRQLIVSVFFFIALFSLLALSSRAVALLDGLLPGGFLLTILSQAALAGACWLAVMWRLPDRRSHWTDLVPGAVLLGVGLALMHLVSRVYLPARFEHSSALYGSLGIAAAILVWLLLFGQLVVWSAIVNVVWFDFRTTRGSGEITGTGVAGSRGGAASEARWEP
ncbi:MAG TPA: YhjD/YihY/BrkB family envelope integrity protein [Intrasporangium sp.]|nr:YhjD/YihY/BrkB family envelope integrity protein [Intrasporangium sp.]